MKRIIFTLAVVGTVMCGTAKERTAAELQQIAAQQLAKTSANGAKAFGKAAKGFSLTCALNEKGIAIYTAEGYGSVLMTTNDDFSPVIGYTNAVITDLTALPCGMQWWLEEMQKLANSEAAEGKAYKTVQVAGKSYDAVEPLVTTRWGQSSPFSDFCPKISDQRPPTGCLATAMAQILNYNQYPKSASFTSTFVTTDNGTVTNHTETVKDTYSYPYKTAYGNYSSTGATVNDYNMSYTMLEGKKIAQLLRDCGYGVHMQYALNGSGATTADGAIAAVDFFSYPQEAIKHYFRRLYTDDEWHNIVYGEIAAGYPVLYGGVDASSGGHAFVANGIDSDGLVYVNWGWNGWYDGYYAMDLMNPSNYQFSYNQMLITGWHPTALSTDVFQSQWMASDLTFSTDATKKAVNFGGTLANVSPVTFSGQVAIMFTDQATKKTYAELLLQETDESTPYGAGWAWKESDIAEDLTFLENGHTYKVYFASELTDESEYQMVRTEGGRFYYMLSLDDSGNVTISDQQIDTTTGIHSASPSADEKAQDGATYNLQGQRVNQPAKGIYIQNGRKFINR